ncbi:MAG TPA: hypothetical protein PJ988_06765 [Anaerolinea sp.]|nr:hypothetical protein [Anaerolinea sp.]
MTNNAFDVRTIVFISAIMLYVLGLLMVIYWRSRITFIGFGYWVVANFAAASGLLLIVLRGQIPDLISIILSNTLILYSLVLTYEGFQRFFYRGYLNLPNHLLLLVFVLLQAVFTYVFPRLNLRVALVSAVVAILSLRISLILFRAPSGRLRTTWPSSFWPSRLSPRLASFMACSSLTCRIFRPTRPSRLSLSPPSEPTQY